MIAGLEPLTSKVSHDLSRDEILEAHARHESSQQSWTPAKRYAELLPTVYKRLAEEWGVSVTLEECHTYDQSVKNGLAFPDSVGAHQYLKKHYKLVILSNIDNESFNASNDSLGVEFDAVYSAEDVGSYKPSIRNFDYMLEKLKGLSMERQDILHTAESMFHDHAPANKYRLASCWIYRRNEQEGFGATMNAGEMPKYDFQFNGMADLVMAHQDALRT